MDKPLELQRKSKMNIYNNDGKSSSRRKSKCSYCRAEGHNATECPRVAEDYAWFSQSPPVIPIGVSKSTATCQWYSNPKYWGEWYQKCIDAHAKQEAAKKKIKSSPAGSARSAPKCGFCGSIHHNRRNCDAMTDYTADAIAANRNWRRAFYEKFVQEMGISEGALLNVAQKQGYGNPDKETIAVVTAVNWDELSLFCGSPNTSGYCYRDENYKQYLKVTVQIGSDTHTLNFEKGIDHRISNKTKRNLVKFSGQRYGWGNPHFISVLSAAPTPLGAEWINEGHAKAMEFLTKKRSKAKLDEADVTDLIKLWL